MKMGRAAACVALSVLLGCGAERARIAYRIDSLAGLVVSSAPAVYEAPEPIVRGGHVAFVYPILAENHGATAAELELVGARAAFVPEAHDEPLEPFRVTCLEREPSRRTSAVAVLAPRARVRVDCTVELPRDQLHKARNADREIALALPVRAAGQSKIVLLSYLLFSGDVP